MSIDSVGHKPTQQLIIGSTAMHHHMESRAPKDFDVFSPNAEGADSFWDDRMAEWIPPGTSRYATLDELYTIKASHAYWELRNGSWNKHMWDLVELKNAGAVLDLELHAMLYQCWEDLHGRKPVNLELEADQFFSDAVKRTYDHDSLHESVAYGERPLYESVLRDGRSVTMDMRKIKALPHEDCVRLFREEIYVTALERLIIPNQYRYSAKRAYAWALRRTITSLTKGWSARFIVDNYQQFRLPDTDYIARHLDNQDRLIPLKETA